MDYTEAFKTQFHPLQLFKDNNPHYIDSENGKDPYCEDHLYDKENLQFLQDNYPSTDDEDCNGCLIPSLDQTLRRPEFGARYCGSLPNTACFLE